MVFQSPIATTLMSDSPRGRPVARKRSASARDPRLRHGVAAAGAADQDVIAVPREGDGRLEVDDLRHR